MIMLKTVAINGRGPTLTSVDNNNNTLWGALSISEGKDSLVCQFESTANTKTMLDTAKCSEIQSLGNYVLED